MGQKRNKTKNIRIPSRVACGIDVHKEKCAVRIVDASIGGMVPDGLEEHIESLNSQLRRIKSDTEGLSNLADILSGFDEVGILMENSTKTHDVYRILTGLNLDITVAHSTDLYRITHSTTKNDDNDALELANYMRRKMNGEDEFSVCHIPDSDTMARRELSRFLADQCRILTRYKKQTRMHLLLRGKSINCRDISSKVAIIQLKKMNDAVLALHGAAMERMKLLISYTKKVLEQYFVGCRMYEIIHSIPGFGIHSAAYVTSMIDDISRFKTGKDLSCYFGLRPRQSDSADSNHDLPISKRGDKLARKLIYQATLVHVSTETDSIVKRKFDRLTARKKPFKVCVVACANEMIMLIHSMVKKDRLFIGDPEVLRKSRLRAESMDIDGLDNRDCFDMMQAVVCEKC